MRSDTPLLIAGFSDLFFKDLLIYLASLLAYSPSFLSLKNVSASTLQPLVGVFCAFFCIIIEMHKKPPSITFFAIFAPLM
jgi:hypothetical protein